MYAYVMGDWTDSWLARLFPGAIGYSPAPYKMIAKVVKVNTDGSAVVTGTRREETSEYYRADNGTLLRRVIYTHVETEPETVKPGSWELLSSEDVMRENKYRSPDNQLTA